MNEADASTALVPSSLPMTEAIVAGDVDFGLAINPRLTHGLEVIAQKEFRVGAVMPPDHHLARVTIGGLQVRHVDTQKSTVTT